MFVFSEALDTTFLSKRHLSFPILPYDHRLLFLCPSRVLLPNPLRLSSGPFLPSLHSSSVILSMPQSPRPMTPNAVFLSSLLVLTQDLISNCLLMVITWTNSKSFAAVVPQLCPSTLSYFCLQFSLTLRFKLWVLSNNLPVFCDPPKRRNITATDA